MACFNLNLDTFLRDNEVIKKTQQNKLQSFYAKRILSVILISVIKN